MAEFQSGHGGGGPNLKRLVATPAFLIIAGIAVLALVYLWWSSRSSGNAAAQGGVVANPLTGPAEGPQTLSTVDLSGLQAGLSQLTQTISSGRATGPSANTPDVSNPSNWKLAGGNSYEYAPGGTPAPFDLGGYQYTFLTNPTAAQTAQNAGEQLWWFAGPGSGPTPGAIPGTTGAGYVRSPVGQ